MKSQLTPCFHWLACQCQSLEWVSCVPHLHQPVCHSRIMGIPCLLDIHIPQKLHNETLTTLGQILCLWGTTWTLLAKTFWIISLFSSPYQHQYKFPLKLNLSPSGSLVLHECIVPAPYNHLVALWMGHHHIMGWPSQPLQHHPKFNQYPFVLTVPYSAICFNRSLYRKVTVYE